MTKMGVFVNLANCSDTRGCMLACKLAKNGFIGSHYVETYTAMSDSFPKPNTYFIPVLCQHCDKPACMAACEKGVIVKREDGIVMAEDVSKCEECSTLACVGACPYSAISYDAKSKTIGKCDLCHERIDRGETPACMAECMTESWLCGDLDDPESYISIVLASVGDDVHQLCLGAGTGPNVYYYLPNKEWKEFDALYSPAWHE